MKKILMLNISIFFIVLSLYISFSLCEKRTLIFRDPFADFQEVTNGEDKIECQHSEPPGVTRIFSVTEYAYVLCDPSKGGLNITVEKNSKVKLQYHSNRSIYGSIIIFEEVKVLHRINGIIMVYSSNGNYQIPLTFDSKYTHYPVSLGNLVALDDIEICFYGPNDRYYLSFLLMKELKMDA